jgi:hypothetical protein
MLSKSSRDKIRAAQKNLEKELCGNELGADKISARSPHPAGESEGFDSVKESPEVLKHISLYLRKEHNILSGSPTSARVTGRGFECAGV